MLKYRLRVKKILSLSLPAALNYLLGMIQTMIDMMFVGRISSVSVAAVGVSMQYIGMLFAFMSLFYMGTNALVSRFTGAGRKEDAGSVIFSMAVVAIVLSVPLMVVGALKSEYFFLLLGTGPEVAKTGAEYLGLFSLIIPLMYLNGVIFSGFNATGDTKTPLFIGIMGNIVNTTFDYILIFGHFGFQSYGVKGAAYAIIIGKCFETVLYLFFTFYKKKIPFEFRFSFDLVRRAMKVGIPTWLERIMTHPTYLVLASFTAAYGTKTLAGYQIGLRIEGLAFMPGIGFMIAGMVLVGQNIGAQDIEGAREDGIVAAFTGAVMMGMVGLLMFIFPHQLAGLFTEDAQTIKEAADYLRVMGISQIPLGVAFVMAGNLRGAGATSITLVVSALSLWGLRILPAYILYLMKVGVIWLYIVAALETCIRAYILTKIFLRGKWKDIKV